MLALDVAASAPSPRKRPTQIALIVPFSDWRIEEASVGSAKASRVLPIGPCGEVAAPRSALCCCVCHASPSVTLNSFQGPFPCQRSAAPRWIPNQVQHDG